MAMRCYCPEMGEGNLLRRWPSLGSWAVTALKGKDGFVRCDGCRNARRETLIVLWYQLGQKESTRACSCIKKESVGSEDDDIQSQTTAVRYVNPMSMSHCLLNNLLSVSLLCNGKSKLMDLRQRGGGGGAQG